MSSWQFIGSVVPAKTFEIVNRLALESIFIVNTVEYDWNQSPIMVSEPKLFLLIFCVSSLQFIGSVVPAKKWQDIAKCEGKIWDPQKFQLQFEKISGKDIW